MAKTLFFILAIAFFTSFANCELLNKYNNFENQAKNSKVPEIVYETHTARIWHLKDLSFEPKSVYLNFKLVSPIKYSSLLNFAKSQLLMYLIRENIDKKIEDDNRHKEFVRMSELPHGFLIACKSQKGTAVVRNMAASAFQAMSPISIDGQTFEEVKRRNVELLENRVNRKRIQNVAYKFSILLQSSIAFTDEEILTTMRDISYEQIEKFRNEFFSKLNIELLAYGDIEKEEAIATMKQAFNMLENRYNTKPFSSNEIHRIRTVELPEGSNFVFSTEIKDIVETGVFFLLQVPPARNLKEDATNVLAMDFVKHLGVRKWPKSYTSQLGFHIGQRNGVPTVEYYGQGSHSAEDIESRMEADLVRQQRYIILNISDERFQLSKESLVESILDKDDSYNMDLAARRYWKEIESEEYYADKRDLANAVSKLTKEDVLNYYQEKLGANSPKRRKLVVYVRPVNSPAFVDQNLGFKKDGKASIITNWKDFKKSMQLYPVVKKHTNVKPIGIL